jgi:hypothetical protein
MFPKTVAKLSVRDATTCSRRCLQPAEPHVSPDAHAKGCRPTGALLYSLASVSAGREEGRGRERTNDHAAREGRGEPSTREVSVSSTGRGR